MSKIAVIIAAGLAVFALVVVSASAQDLTVGVTAADRCLVCHPRAHSADWNTSHGAQLAFDPQQNLACTRCHAMSFCDDCHNAGGADADGMAPEQLVSTLCSRCHSIGVVQGVRKDRAGWTATVEKMMGHGLAIDGPQQTAIIEYLTTQYGL